MISHYAFCAKDADFCDDVVIGLGNGRNILWRTVETPFCPWPWDYVFPSPMKIEEERVSTTTSHISTIHNTLPILPSALHNYDTSIRDFIS
jgi:hypothetical protein